ncbi:MAG: PTS sugar transporter subunit IIB [Deltaproteobacteria bacterium]|nr:PTS sugar transporter subunit IIB [Candidatus Zymogenaceae bacterium]
MGIILVRVDSRLIHGQILEAWIPHTGSDALMVVDDEVAGDLLRRTVMQMAVPSSISVSFETVQDAVSQYKQNGFQGRKMMLLFSKLDDAVNAFRNGLNFNALNLGNMHYCEGKVQVCANICLDSDDLTRIMYLEKMGVYIDSRSVPGEKKLDLSKTAFLKKQLF